MTDFVHQAAFPALTIAEQRLVGVLAHPKIVALGCVVVLAAFGWIALALLAVGRLPLASLDTLIEGRVPWDVTWQSLCQSALIGGWVGLVVAVPMWLAMILAMMLPTAGPMILTYAELADTAVRRGEAVISPMVLTFGYIAVWFGFAFAAALLQWMLTEGGILQKNNADQYVSAGLFLVAGFYQFSYLKRACLRQCQRPFPFFFANWTTERRGVFRLGWRQGILCLGCCWVLMLLMLAGGAMNPIWMAMLGILMTMEKMTPASHLRQSIGVGFVVIGTIMAIMPIS